MSEILSADEWRYHMLGAKGDDRTHDWLVLERDREALRARVRDLTAALGHALSTLRAVKADRPSAHSDEVWVDVLTCINTVSAALGAVPQPARCPTCGVTEREVFGDTCLERHIPDPWHREAQQWMTRSGKTLGRTPS